ncbi:SLC13 family permease [bacterium]|nr:SLC13 family permease [bacterium]
MALPLGIKEIHMTFQTWLVFGILAVTIFLFVLDRIRLDIVALMSLLALLLTGILTPGEALAGFSDQLVLTIAGLFVVGGGLFRTGVAAAVGRWLSKVAGTNYVTLTLIMMIVVSLLSAFMSSTGATAVLVPVVVSIAWNAKISPSKLLIPLSFGALFGGMLTLLGTPPNLAVSNELVANGMEPFGFFAFTPFAAIALVAGIAFIATFGRRLLPDRESMDNDHEAQADAPTLEELAHTYHLPDQLFTLRVRRPSPLVGKTLGESEIGAAYRVNVLEVQTQAPSRFGNAVRRWNGNGYAESSGNDHSNGHTQLTGGNGGVAVVATPIVERLEATADGSNERPIQTISRPAEAEMVLRADDLLHVQGYQDDVLRMARELNLGLCTDEEPHRLRCKELGLAEIMFTPDSQMLGHTLQELHFRTVYGVTALGIRRMGKPLNEDPGKTKLRFGDSLLVEGQWERIERLQKERRNVVVVGLPKEMAEAGQATELAPLAVAIMVGMLLLITFGILPTVTSVLLAAVAMVVTGCLRAELLYRTISWESVVLIAGMLPMSTALQKTGGVQVMANLLTENLGTWGPLAVLAGLFIATALATQFLSNTATSVLMAPIAFQAAVTLGVAPHAFLMAVAMAASSAFLTPIASPVNTIVLAAGGYRFFDFFKIGLPLLLLMLGLSVLLLPVFFPL